MFTLLITISDKNQSSVNHFLGLNFGNRLIIKKGNVIRKSVKNIVLSWHHLQTTYLSTNVIIIIDL